MEPNTPVDRFLFGSIYRRKLYHFFGGSVLILSLLHLDDLWVILLGLAYFAFFWMLTGRYSFLILSIILLIIISNSRLSTLAGVSIWVVGDGFSALFGSAFGSIKWWWTEKKSIIGSATFLVAGICAIMILLFFYDVNSPREILYLSLLPSLVGCVLELTSNPRIAGIYIGDNSSVILGCGLSFHLIAILLGVSL